MQIFEFCPNLIKFFPNFTEFYQILPNLSKFAQIAKFSQIGLNFAKFALKYLIEDAGRILWIPSSYAAAKSDTLPEFNIWR